VLALTVFAHWLQFKLLRIPLPFERTSIFAVPLATALVGAILSVAPSNRIMRAARAFGVAILLITSLYFAGELRDSYFRTWRGDSEIRPAFWVVLDLCRHTGVREVISNLNLTRSFNFYRALYKVNDIDDLANYEKLPPHKPIYVLMESSDRDFIRTEGLQVVWRGSVSGEVVVVRPGTFNTLSR
jgi:hypothetical protein